MLEIGIVYHVTRLVRRCEKKKSNPDIFFKISCKRILTASNVLNLLFDIVLVTHCFRPLAPFTLKENVFKHICILSFCSQNNDIIFVTLDCTVFESCKKKLNLLFLFHYSTYPEHLSIYYTVVTIQFNS